MDPGERTVIYFVCNNIGWFAFKEQKLKWKERDRDREWEFHILSTGPAKKKKKKTLAFGIGFPHLLFQTLLHAVQSTSLSYLFFQRDSDKIVSYTPPPLFKMIIP